VGGFNRTDGSEGGGGFLLLSSLRGDGKAGESIKRPKIAKNHSVQWWWVGGIVERVNCVVER
jgi:hypothetical protein